ncbi:MAG: BON domain-containing protein [Elainella sp. Prado103]|nr:BON domain-containing protein [Elainella sp. Prado103]
MMEPHRQCIGQSISASLFRSIPPERIGLSGEYDHQGLAKRVKLAFQELVLKQELSRSEIERLRVTQRGAVVVIVGFVPDQKLLIKLVNIAMAVSGTADVEVNGMSVGYSLKRYLEVKPARETLLQIQKLLMPPELMSS